MDSDVSLSCELVRRARTRWTATAVARAMTMATPGQTNHATAAAVPPPTTTATGPAQQARQATAAKIRRRRISGSSQSLDITPPEYWHIGSDRWMGMLVRQTRPAPHTSRSTSRWNGANVGGQGTRRIHRCVKRECRRGAETGPIQSGPIQGKGRPCCSSTNTSARPSPARGLGWNDRAET